MTRKRPEAASTDLSGGHWTSGVELQMMTSATLIEALYDAVDEWLREKSKSSIGELNEQACFATLFLQYIYIYIYGFDV